MTMMGKNTRFFGVILLDKKQLSEHHVNVSMDGKGRARDNSRTERFFRSLKYELIYLNEYENPRALRRAITAYL